MEIFKSDKPSKRFYAQIGPKRIYFGQPGGFTFIDGATEAARAAYRKRHYANKAERYYIENDILSPALLSWHILWGDSPDIYENITNF
jgi:hypothetical protein